MIDNDKDWFRSLTPYQVTEIHRVLRPDQAAPFLSVINRILQEDYDKVQSAQKMETAK